MDQTRDEERGRWTLDRGATSVLDLPAPDEKRLERLNTLWRLAGEPPAHASIGRRLTWRVRRLIARALGPQETFNAAVVEHINSTVELHRALAEVASSVEEVGRHREALAARERRIEAAMAAITATHEELRASVGVLQQATQTLKREVARLAAAGAAARPPESGAPAGGGAAIVRSVEETLDSHKYVGFEDQFRGSADEIRGRLADYVPLFAGAADVLDVGCGRGEFLDLLRARGVLARGVDVNQAMVDVCREKGLQAETADALAYLRAQRDGSFGGLFAAQVVEHLEPAYLRGLLDEAFDKLRPGSPIVLETINPACWFAFFESYIRDITHVRPIHPDTLRFLLVASGFQKVEIQYRSPYPDADKLQAIPTPAPGAGHALENAVDTLNANVDKINRLLFTHLDYAAVGRRP